jgi:hypothetical protein
MAAGMRKSREKKSVDKKKFMAALKDGVARMTAGPKADMAAGKHNPPTAKSTNRW